MKRLFKYVKRYWFRYLIAMTVLAVAIILDMFNPMITQSIIDDVIKGKQYGLFHSLIITLIIIFIGKTILGYIREYLFDSTGIRVAYDLRKDLFDHIQSLSFNYFDTMNTGKIMSRVKEDVDNVWQAVSYGIMLVVDQLLYFIIGTVMLFRLNYKLALVSMIAIPIIGILAVKFENKVGKTFSDISDQTAKLNTIAQENITGVRLVKAFARERFEINKFFKQNKTFYKLNVQQANTIAQYFPKIEFVSNIATVLVIVVGGYLVIGEEISLGTLVAFSGYMSMLISPMRMIGWLANIMAQCMASLKKINKIFDVQPDIKDSRNALKLNDSKGKLEFNNVTFKYGNKKVLNNISFVAQPGETIAIMGTTGSGKSSIINLIGRYYDLQEGSIKLDGNDIKKIRLKDLRKQISVVMQDTFLFSDTIKANLKFGNEKINDDEIKKMSQNAQVDEFVDKMRDKYDTVIGERGLGLSGGQKQRISIARALIKNSSILVLDDATSALDMETEKKIQSSINKIDGATKIIIAHRISAVKEADKILIIEDGKIVEEGNHKSLLEKKGKYFEIFNEQIAS